MGDNMAKLGKKLRGLGEGMSTFITAPLAGLAAVGIKEAQETATAMAQVNASLASMGPVAGRTAGQLQNFANALEMKSTFEADQILKDVTATMLTFGNVTGKTFDRAQQAAVDLATKFGKGLPEAAVMVGKALNDPIRGLTALSRVGVSFTEGEREQVKAMVATGNAAGAQQVILAALEKQVKGSAEAAQNADPWNKLSDSFKNIAESIGTLLLPLIPPLASALEGVANWVSSLSPTTQTWVVGLGAAAAAIGPLMLGLAPMVTAVGKLLPLLTGLVPIVASFGRAILALAVAGGPLTIALLAIGAIYVAWQNWDKISAVLQRLYSAVKTWLVDKLNAVLNSVKAKINAVGDWFHDLYERVVGHSDVPDLIDGVAYHFGRLQEEMVKPAQVAAQQVMQAFGDIAGKAIDDFGSAIADAALGTKSLADSFADMAKSIIHDLIEMTTRFLIFRAIAGLFGGGLVNNAGGLPSGWSGANPTAGPIGMANGGSGVFGGFAGVDQNVLSYNGSPIARVSKGERFSVGNDNGRSPVQVQIVPTPYFNAVVDDRAQGVVVRTAPMLQASIKASIQDDSRRRG